MKTSIVFHDFQSFESLFLVSSVVSMDILRVMVQCDLSNKYRKTESVQMKCSNLLQFKHCSKKILKTKFVVRPCVNKSVKTIFEMAGDLIKNSSLRAVNLFI